MNISNAVLVLSFLNFAPLASGQATSLLPTGESSTGLTSDTARGIELSTPRRVENQQTCPQALGDAWDTTSEQAWNVLEVGVQIKPEQKQRAEPQLYTRYTCPRPLDRPGGLAGR